MSIRRMPHGPGNQAEIAARTPFGLWTLTARTVGLRWSDFVRLPGGLRLDDVHDRLQVPPVLARLRDEVGFPRIAADVVASHQPDPAAHLADGTVLVKAQGDGVPDDEGKRGTLRRRGRRAQGISREDSHDEYSGGPSIHHRHTLLADAQRSCDARVDASVGLFFTAAVGHWC